MKVYRVKSETNPKRMYKIRHFPKVGVFVCDCPAHAFNKEGFECKHIKKVKQYLKI